MNWEEYVYKYQPQTREQAFADGTRIGFENAIIALSNYDPASEVVTRCMHNTEWATWLMDRYRETFKQEIESNDAPTV